MSRLPVSNETNWGNVLNDYLLTSHGTDGTLKQAAVVGAGAITNVNGKVATSGTVSLKASDVGALTQTTADQRYTISLPILYWDGTASPPERPSADQQVRWMTPLTAAQTIPFIPGDEWLSTDTPIN